MKKLIAWTEIPATDFNRAVEFYKSILNIDFKVFDFGTEKMACFPNDEGAISQAEGFEPSKNGVLVSLNTGNKLDEVLEKIKTKGCEIVKPKTKIEAENRGHFALFIDSEGNKIGLYGE